MADDDTEHPPLEDNHDPAGAPQEKVRFRTFDGSYNDLGCPAMGKQGARFGSNFPLARVYPDTPNLMTPSPRTISGRLLTREFKPWKKSEKFAQLLADRLPWPTLCGRPRRRVTSDRDLTGSMGKDRRMRRVKLQNWKRTISYYASSVERVSNVAEIVRIVQDRIEPDPGH